MEKGLIFAWSCIIIFCSIMMGSYIYQQGYQKGYQQGFVDGEKSVNTDAIFHDGFNKGVEFNKNWTTCTWSGLHFGYDHLVMCSKSDPRFVRATDDHYNKKYEYYSPVFSNTSYTWGAYFTINSTYADWNI